VVCHINDSAAQTASALRNVNNHLEVNPPAQIILVTHAQGVEFDVCLITLRNRNIDKNKFIPEAQFVLSGVAGITRLQQREGYACPRP